MEDKKYHNLMRCLIYEIGLKLIRCKPDSWRNSIVILTNFYLHFISGVGPVPSKGAGVRGHHLNPPGVAESQKIPASHPAPAGSQNLGRDQGQPGSQSQRERDLR